MTVPSSTFQTDNISNSTATSVVPENYEICQRTGFKQLPIWHPHSEFTVDGYGDYMRKKSIDSRHPQDYIKSRGNDRHEGPQNPEATDDFSITSTSITVEDL